MSNKPPVSLRTIKEVQADIATVHIEHDMTVECLTNFRDKRLARLELEANCITHQQMVAEKGGDS